MTYHNWQPMYCKICKERYSNIGVKGGYWKNWNKYCNKCANKKYLYVLEKVLDL